jgi:NAD+ diphosphatase
MNEIILFFQGNDIVVPKDFSETDIINLLSEDDSRNHIDWQKDLLMFAHSFGNITPLITPKLNGSKKTSAVMLQNSVLLSDTWKRVPIRSLLAFAQRDENGFSPNIQDLFRSYHLLQWKNNTQFCGRCGKRNFDSQKDVSRVCSSCGNISFPKISPAVIVLITDDKDRILLAHNKNFKENMYSLLAGFVEAGESLEQTVVREIKEEVNIDVNSIQYIHSQPWPFPDSIMLGFRAKHIGGELKPDGEEIIDAQWFSRSNLPEIPGPGAIARFLIDEWKEGKYKCSN